MTEQMQDHFERIGKVDGMLGEINDTAFARTWGVRKLRAARRLLTETIAQLCQDYGKMARARDAAVELLLWIREIKDDHGGYLDKPYPIFSDEERIQITQTIALLEGEDNEAERGIAQAQN